VENQLKPTDLEKSCSITTPVIFMKWTVFGHSVHKVHGVPDACIVIQQGRLRLVSLLVWCQMLFSWSEPGGMVSYMCTFYQCAHVHMLQSGLENL